MRIMTAEGRIYRQQIFGEQPRAFSRAPGAAVSHAWFVRGFSLGNRRAV